MQITHTIALDLQCPVSQPRIRVKQGDAYSHYVELQLYDRGEPFLIPEDTQLTIRWRAQGQTGGMGSQGVYETLPSGMPAYRFDGNLLQFIPSPQMFSIPGVVEADVVLKENGQTLATCTVEFYVNQAPVNTTSV